MPDRGRIEMYYRASLAMRIFVPQSQILGMLGMGVSTENGWSG